MSYCKKIMKMDNGVKSSPFFDIDMPKLNQVQNTAIDILDYFYFYDITSLHTFSQAKIDCYTDVLRAIDEINEKRNFLKPKSELYKHFLLCGLETFGSSKNYNLPSERLMSFSAKILTRKLIYRLKSMVEANDFIADHYMQDLNSIMSKFNNRPLSKVIY